MEYRGLGNGGSSIKDGKASIRPSLRILSCSMTEHRFRKCLQSKTKILLQTLPISKLRKCANCGGNLNRPPPMYVFLGPNRGGPFKVVGMFCCPSIPPSPLHFPHLQNSPALLRSAQLRVFPVGAKSGINLLLLPSSESVEGNLGMRSREAANPNGMG